MSKIRRHEFVGLLEEESFEADNSVARELVLQSLANVSSGDCPCNSLVAAYRMLKQTKETKSNLFCFSRTFWSNTDTTMRIVG